MKTYSSEEVEKLQDRIAELEAELGIDPPVYGCFGLTRVQERMFGMLMAREAVRVEGFYLCALRASSELNEPEGMVRTNMSHLRKIFAPLGVEISTVWQFGYCLKPAMKQKVRELMAIKDAA